MSTTASGPAATVLAADRDGRRCPSALAAPVPHHPRPRPAAATLLAGRHRARRRDLAALECTSRYRGR